MSGSGPVGRKDDGRILSQADSEKISKQVISKATGVGQTHPTLTSVWTGELRWGRNRVTLASDRREVQVKVRRQWQGVSAEAVTNQTDDASLAGLVRSAEQSVAGSGPSGMGQQRDFIPAGPVQETPKPKIWSDATFNLNAEARAAVARTLVEEAEAKGLLSAGYLEARAGTWMQSINGASCYIAYTQAHCSVTVRDPEGTASGWAGLSSYDWAKIDAPALAKRALAKCVASRNPVALEPGRYTVILEPQAVADLMQPFLYNFDRSGNEGPFCCAPLQLAPAQAKLGLKVMDERITISHDPTDPELGILPEPGMEAVTWIEKGVTVNLGHDRSYARENLLSNRPVQSPLDGYRMSGGTTSVEEMIASTQRGLLVTRFWDVKGDSGFTRDGLWLIENGKISKPVKNFRFVQSALVSLNQIEQLGVPVPVFRPVREPRNSFIYRSPNELAHPPRSLSPAIVPPLKVRDFSFTAMADAV